MPDPQERREAEAQSALFAEDPASCGCTSVGIVRGSAAFALGSCREPEFEWLYFERNVATGSTGRELTVLCTLHFALCTLHAVLVCTRFSVGEGPKARRGGPTRYATVAWVVSLLHLLAYCLPLRRF